jgi:beta-barrel assembly-enhancing protease
MVSSPITHKNAQKMIRRALCMTGCSLSLLLSQVSVYSTPVFANSVQASSKANEAAIEDEKPIYPIAEKLIRANGLDDYTWRITVEDKYDDNAVARDVNQVIILKGLMDKIYGDDAALAFVISHEIAHHTQRHIS